MVEITKHYLISGRVQGVGFRAFTMRTAAQLGLRGWVRNLSDGRVEAVAQGSNDLLEKFAVRLRVGPSQGEVESLTVTDWSNSEDNAGFSIRKDGFKPCLFK